MPYSVDQRCESDTCGTSKPFFVRDGLRQQLLNFIVEGYDWVLDVMPDRVVIAIIAQSRYFRRKIGTLKRVSLKRAGAPKV